MKGLDNMDKNTAIKIAQGISDLMDDFVLVVRQGENDFCVVSGSCYSGGEENVIDVFCHGC
jgi:hypothetical protein